MTRTDPQPAPDADVTAGTSERSDRIVAIVLAAAAGVLLTRVVVAILSAFPPPRVDYPDGIAPVVGAAKWWLPALVGVLFAISEVDRGGARHLRLRPVPPEPLAADRVAEPARAGQRRDQAPPPRGGQGIIPNDALVRLTGAVLIETHDEWQVIERLSAELRGAHPKVAWADVIGHRNVLIHDYRRLIHGLIWWWWPRLPVLSERLQAIMSATAGDRP